MDLGGNQTENAPLHNESGPNFTNTEVPIFPKTGIQGATTSQSTLRARPIVEPGRKSNMTIFTGGLSPLATPASKIMPYKPLSSASAAVDSISHFDLSSLVSALDVPTELYGSCLSPVDSSACSGLRSQLKLELLRSKDRSGKPSCRHSTVQ